VSRGLIFFGETRLVGEERTPPVAVTFPDSRLGGNQYITSTSTGAWEDLLLYEMLPAIEQRLGLAVAGAAACSARAPADTGRGLSCGTCRRRIPQQRSGVDYRTMRPYLSSPRPCPVDICSRHFTLHLRVLACPEIGITPGINRQPQFRDASANPKGAGPMGWGTRSTLSQFLERMAYRGTQNRREKRAGKPEPYL